MEGDRISIRTAGGTGQYRFILEPYSGPGSRHSCPRCGAPHKFSRYIDTETGQYVADTCGRCDREDSCGYHLKPREYFSLHQDSGNEYRPRRTRKAPAIVRDYTPPRPLESYTIPKASIEELYRNEAAAFPGRWPYKDAYSQGEREAAIMQSAFSTNAQSSALAGFLYRTLGRDRFRRIASRYFLASWRGAAVFWYIDRGRHIRTGKAMYYKEDGHRNKNCNPFFIHRLKELEPALPEGWTLRRCLFGEHLLAVEPEAPVMLVESEKTAMIAAALAEVPGIWLAAGGKQYLKEDCCNGLKGRQVIAYPDLGAFDSWKIKLESLAGTCGFNVAISDFLERRATDEERTAGLDIADYLLKEI